MRVTPLAGLLWSRVRTNVSVWVLSSPATMSRALETNATTYPESSSWGRVEPETAWVPLTLRLTSTVRPVTVLCQ